MLFPFNIDILKAKRMPESTSVVPSLHFEINDRRGDLGKSSFTSQNEPKVGNLPDASAAPSEAIKNRFPALWWLFWQLFKHKYTRPQTRTIAKENENASFHHFVIYV